MGEFSDHPNKIIIRDLWCKPIIRHLYETLGAKLVYLGLPGLKAIDLITWIDFLDYVIAIDCGDYSKPYNLEKARDKIQTLNTVLNRLERENRISGYSLYLGYIEQVILKGFDKNGEKFSLSQTVNIYNLDFCNSLTAPLTIVDLKGNRFTYFKNEVIRKLLEFERDLEKPDSQKKFVMFITIHSKFFFDEAAQHFTSKGDEIFLDYRRFLEGLTDFEKNLRLLRYYFLDILKYHFTTTGFIPYFFPTIFYKGVGNNFLLTFTVVGKYVKSPSAIAPFSQDLDSLIHQKFITPHKGKIDYLATSLHEEDPIIDVRGLLDESLY
jgi:hypothetical protein